MEAEAFLLAMKGLKLPDGRDRLVRHGHGPERTIQTGIGPVEVERVKIRDRGAAGGGERVRFTSAILPIDWRFGPLNLNEFAERGPTNDGFQATNAYPFMNSPSRNGENT